MNIFGAIARVFAGTSPLETDTSACASRVTGQGSDPGKILPQKQTTARPAVTLVRGDVVSVLADAIVSPTDRCMTACSETSAAIHDKSGQWLRQACDEAYPDGLAPGQVGVTPSGGLPVPWVLHVQVPEVDGVAEGVVALRECYFAALGAAERSGLASVALPVLGTGAAGWPVRDAVEAAFTALAEVRSTTVRSATLVVLSEDVYREAVGQWHSWTALRLLQAVGLLHDQGYHSIRATPAMSPSGMHWRLRIQHMLPATADGLERSYGELMYSTAAQTDVAGRSVTINSDVAEVAQHILRKVTSGHKDYGMPKGSDPAYAAWFAGLMDLVGASCLPIASADYFDDRDGWEIGWGSGKRYPHPPAVPAVELV